MVRAVGPVVLDRRYPVVYGGGKIQRWLSIRRYAAATPEGKDDTEGKNETSAAVGLAN